MCVYVCVLFFWRYKKNFSYTLWQNYSCPSSIHSPFLSDGTKSERDLSEIKATQNKDYISQTLRQLGLAI